MVDDSQIELLSIDDYCAALVAVKPTDKQWKMLELHVARPGFAITATEMAHHLKYKSFEAANSQYGTFAGKVCKYLGLELETKLHVFVEFWKGRNSDFTWVLRPQVVEAISLLRLKPKHIEIPHEVLDGDELFLFEGAKKLTLTERVKRNNKARLECVQQHGYSCVACGFNFESTYGLLGRGFVEVHHLNMLANAEKERAVNPITDLVPLCSNCHRMVHRTDPMTSISMLKSIFANP